jgi:hypothetical protein
MKLKKIFSNLFSNKKNKNDEMFCSMCIEPMLEAVVAASPEDTLKQVPLPVASPVATRHSTIATPHSVMAEVIADPNSKTLVAEVMFPLETAQKLFPDEVYTKNSSSNDEDQGFFLFKQFRFSSEFVTFITIYASIVALICLLRWAIPTLATGFAIVQIEENPLQLFTESTLGSQVSLAHPNIDTSHIFNFVSSVRAEQQNFSFDFKSRLEAVDLPAILENCANFIGSARDDFVNFSTQIKSQELAKFSAILETQNLEDILTAY